jgi:hypothetical protein
MILTKEIRVELTQFNYHHYKRLGYDTENKSFLIIKIEDIGNRTPTKIDVKCDLCGKEKNINYRKYTDNISKYNIYTCSNKCAMFKNEETNLQKYGYTHQCKNDEVQDKILKTKLQKGIISNSIEDFSDYRRIVNNLTNRVKKYLFNNWDGFDYYDKENIKENINLNYNDINYPTIDHKKSVFMSYKEGLSPEIVASIENLCITKRSNNSSKGYKNEDVYINEKTQS